MPRSPYAAVNERRRKRAYNRRSTAQLARRARENPEREQRRIARLDNKAWLRANAEQILAEARAEVAASRARVPLAREQVPTDAQVVEQVEAMGRDEAQETMRVGRVVPVRGSRRARPHPRRLP